MNRMFYLDIDLNGNQILRPVMHNSDTDPVDAKPGQVYFNTTDKTFKTFDGTEWTIIPSEKLITDLELVSATALNDLNRRINDLGDNAGSSTSYTTKVTSDESPITISAAVHGCGSYPQVVGFHEGNKCDLGFSSNDKGDLEIDFNGLEVTEAQPLIIRIFG